MTIDPATESPGVRVRHFLTLGLWALAIAVAIVWFAPIKVLLLGVLAAGAVAAALHPLMKWLPGPRAVRAVCLVLVPPLMIATIAYFGGRMIVDRYAQDAAQWPEVERSIDAKLYDWSAKASLAEPITARDLAQRVGESLVGSGGGLLFKTATGAVSGALLALMFVFFGSLYLLIEDPRQYVEPVRALLPPHRRPQLDGALKDLVARLRWWVIGTMVSMSVVGTLSCIGYWLVGLRMALPIGLMTGFSEVVPTLGPASTFLIALLFSVAQGGRVVGGVVIVYGIVQTVESYILTPLVMKKAVDMPPLVTLFTVVLWGQTFGAPGLLLAIPLNLVIWAFVDHMLIRPRRSLFTTEAPRHGVNE